ncbi:MAG TPA: winged helix-turn-helix domain-containing protein [Stellaceae bacterium]|nr:winged helix-turn-helix domain-containing protein [Stellaceae bacterium]
MTDKDPLIIDLIARRQTLGWSLRELSERSGIDEPRLAQWEDGSDLPRLDAAQRWGAALGVKLNLVPAAGEPHRGVRIDWNERRVTVEGVPVRLTPMEWSSLERLARTPGELVTHQMLFHHLYGEERPYRAESTAIRVLITKLRRLLPLQIEARWGQGYVVSGIESPPLRTPAAGTAPAPAAPGIVPEIEPEIEPEPEPETLCPPRGEEDAAAIPRDAPPSQHAIRDLRAPSMQRIASPANRVGLGRSEELGVIERFLAERGATRCPDVATIQQSPLPTLVWDKLKRKWVRPSLTGDDAR